MKKIILFLIPLLIIYIGSRIFFSGRLNPSSLDIDNKIINLPYKMHLDSIFGFHEESFLGLVFAKDPYTIDYPTDRGTYLIVSNAEKHAIILLEPLLTKETLQKFSEKNSSKAIGECILSDNRQRTYMVRNNRGYIVKTDDNLLQKYLVKQFCFSDSHVSHGSPTQIHSTLK